MHTTVINVDALASHFNGNKLNDRHIVIVDCRFSLADTGLGERNYLASHIPGAHYAHLDRDLSSALVPGVTGRHPLPVRAALSQRFRDWGISEYTQIVVYDDKISAIASRFWWLSQWLGHEACAVLDGGFNAWVNAALPVSEQLPDSASGSFAEGSSLMPVVTIDDLGPSAMPDLLLIDAREAIRYRGEHEPIDAVAGHIPGAVNAVFFDNVDEQGMFKSVAELRSRFEPLQQTAGDKTLVHYCGSGVTATHNVLAMKHAGLGSTALYPGSFSEWITRDDEQYPVARLGD